MLRAVTYRLNASSKSAAVGVLPTKLSVPGGGGTSLLPLPISVAPGGVVFTAMPTTHEDVPSGLMAGRVFDHVTAGWLTDHVTNHREVASAGIRSYGTR
jgi:hypothetical protein